MPDTAQSMHKRPFSGSWPLGLPVIFSAILLACSFAVTIDAGDTPRTVNVAANRGWQDTGVSLKVGEEVTVNVTSGRWFEDPPGVWHDANGGPDPWICGDPECHEPMPLQPKYALIGRIGDRGIPFQIGEFYRFFPESTGRLFLRANYGDEDIPIHNPEGALEVTIEYN